MAQDHFKHPNVGRRPETLASAYLGNSGLVRTNTSNLDPEPQILIGYATIIGPFMLAVLEVGRGF